MIAIRDSTARNEKEGDETVISFRKLMRRSGTAERFNRKDSLFSKTEIPLF
jgi:hypothetical protein